jgi:hypothetical protein
MSGDEGERLAKIIGDIAVRRPPCRKRNARLSRGSSRGYGRSTARDTVPTPSLSEAEEFAA